MKKSNIMTDGIIKNNPVFRLVLGACPTLAVTTGAINGLAMGLAATFVLIASNTMVSALRKVIPDKVRIPAFILIIATFVTLVEMIMRKYLPDMYDSLGLFIPLIVVNCVILARAEAFASSNKISDSVLDGFGMGLGFTLSLTLIGMVREFFGAGTIFSSNIPAIQEFSMTIMILPAGGFLVYGLMMAGYNAWNMRTERKKQELNANKDALSMEVK